MEMAAGCLFAALAAALLNVLCVSVYSAMARVRKSYIDNSDDQDPQLIEKIAPYYKKPIYALAGTQLACIICTAVFIFSMEECWEHLVNTAAALAGMEFPLWAEAAAEFVFFAVIILMYWILVFRIPGETALVKPLEKIAGRTWLLRLIRRVLHPFIVFGLFVTRRVMHLRGLSATSESEFTYSEEEIRCIVEESHRGGKLSALENLLIKNSFDFFDLMTEEIMIPRSEMVVLYYGDDVAHMREVIRQSHHTCYPVCMEDKDHILGYVHVKDFLESTAGGETNIKQIIRNILTVPEVMPTPKLLQLMRTRRIYLAVVVDEYGGTVGLVTLEDIIEELIGELPQEKDSDPVEILEKEDGSFEFDGMVILDDISDRLGIEFTEEGGANTIGGHIFSTLERIPQIGDTVDIGGWKFTVLRMDGFRVTRVKAEKLPQEKAETPEEDREE